jgi:hypothetical protein
MTRPSTNWVYFPKSDEPSAFMRSVVQVFLDRDDELNLRSREITSDGILKIVCPGLQALGFEVETGKKKNQKIRVPVLFGRNGTVEKAFEADAWHRAEP